ncbi:hypothetical protein ACHWQZ_G004979 [Mnemiopsis leidyi]
MDYRDSSSSVSYDGFNTPRDVTPLGATSLDSDSDGLEHLAAIAAPIAQIPFTLLRRNVEAQNTKCQFLPTKMPICTSNHDH